MIHMLWILFESQPKYQALMCIYLNLTTCESWNNYIQKSIWNRSSSTWSCGTHLLSNPASTAVKASLDSRILQTSCFTAGPFTIHRWKQVHVWPPWATETNRKVLVQSLSFSQECQASLCFSKEARNLEFCMKSPGVYTFNYTIFFLLVQPEQITIQLVNMA